MRFLLCSGSKDSIDMFSGPLFFVICGKEGASQDIYLLDTWWSRLGNWIVSIIQESEYHHQSLSNRVSHYSIQTRQDWIPILEKGIGFKCVTMKKLSFEGVGRCRGEALVNWSLDFIRSRRIISRDRSNESDGYGQYMNAAVDGRHGNGTTGNMERGLSESCVLK